MSRNPQRMYDNFLRVVDKFFSEHPEHRDLIGLGYAYLFLDAALGYANNGRYGEARTYLTRSILSHPTPSTTTGGGVPS